MPKRRRRGTKFRAVVLTVVAFAAAAPISMAGLVVDMYYPLMEVALFGAPLLAATAASVLVWQSALNRF